MDVDLDFDGVGTKWGYAGWSAKGDANPCLNRNIQNHPMNINGHPFLQGIGTHSPSEIVFDLQGAVKHFSCKAGVDLGAGAEGSVIFVVSADKKKLFTSPLMTTQRDPVTIDLDVTGAKELSLYVDPAGQNNWDQADWADIHFLLAPGMQMTPVVKKHLKHPRYKLLHPTPAPTPSKSKIGKHRKSK